VTANQGLIITQNEECSEVTSSSFVRSRIMNSRHDLDDIGMILGYFRNTRRRKCVIIRAKPANLPRSRDCGQVGTKYRSIVPIMRDWCPSSTATKNEERFPRSIGGNGFLTKRSFDSRGRERARERARNVKQEFSKESSKILGISEQNYQNHVSR